ncbi:Rossmann-like and DUF2520 domain-containing protein [Brumimicrobium salinarum]|nr:DUF2520 domain-containing protein [Brumimicrobium salinarum]
MINKDSDITIFGTGKVAHQLGSELKRKGNHINAVYGRNEQKAKKLSKKLKTKHITSATKIPSNSLVIICISDSAIPKVVASLDKNLKVAYTSGSIRLEDLPDRPYLGVFYPLQTFSINKLVDFSSIPFLIESRSELFEKELKSLASSVSNYVKCANSEDRYNLHIGAVMVNNFSNYLYHLAQKHLDEHDLDFKLLLPLIKETTEKLEILSPIEAQTGPAARGDKKIIQKHLNSISDPKTKALYALFSELIPKEIKKHEL